MPFPDLALSERCHGPAGERDHTRVGDDEPVPPAECPIPPRQARRAAVSVVIAVTDNGAMPQLENASPVGRLLEEISWEGNAKPYRAGGRGRENVLTVEAFAPLDYLPRTRFLGQVIRSAHGADEARRRVAEEIERAEMSLLPGDVFLGQTRVHVQPDATILTPFTYVLVEAKRIRSSSFQVDQLAREFVAVLQEAEDRTPLLLLVLGAPPRSRCAVRGTHRDSHSDICTLANVAAREDLGLTDEELVARVPEVRPGSPGQKSGRSWFAVVTRFRRKAECAGTLRRLCDASVTAIDWHS